MTSRYARELTSYKIRLNEVSGETWSGFSRMLNERVIPQRNPPGAVARDVRYVDIQIKAEASDKADSCGEGSILWNEIVHKVEQSKR